MADVLVIGGGPAGLATSACLEKEGVSHRVVDREGTPGGAYMRMYEGITLASPTSMTELPGLAPIASDLYTTVRDYREYLRRYVAQHELTVEKAEVRKVERKGESFLVELDRERSSYRAVVVATGMWDWPIVPPPCGTIPWLHAREWRGPEEFPDERIAIVGGATSAVEIAEALARAGRTVIVSSRSKLKTIRQRFLGLDLQEWLTPLENLPTSLGKKWCALHPTVPATDLGFGRFRKEGLVDVRPAIARTEGKTLVFTDDSRAEVDRIVFATGYRYETPFLPPDVTREPAGHVKTKDAESIAWPGLFLVGSPCAARFSSEFLRGIRRDAVDVAKRIARRVR